MRQKLLRPPLFPSKAATPLPRNRSTPPPNPNTTPAKRSHRVITPQSAIHARASVLNLPATPSQSPNSHPADAQSIVHPVLRFLITLLLVVLALASAAAVAFGTHPALAKYPSGLE